MKILDASFIHSKKKLLKSYVARYSVGESLERFLL